MFDATTAMKPTRCVRPQLIRKRILQRRLACSQSSGAGTVCSMPYSRYTSFPRKAAGTLRWARRLVAADRENTPRERMVDFWDPLRENVPDALFRPAREPHSDRARLSFFDDLKIPRRAERFSGCYQNFIWAPAVKNWMASGLA